MYNRSTCEVSRRGAESVRAKRRDAVEGCGASVTLPADQRLRTAFGAVLKACESRTIGEDGLFCADSPTRPRPAQRRHGNGIASAAAIVLVLFGFASKPIWGAEAAARVLPVSSFVAASLSDPTLADLVRLEGTLRTSRCCVAGSLEYMIDMPHAGWYTVSALGGGHLVELTVSRPDGSGWETLGHGVGGLESHNGKTRLATLRLATGPHRLKLAYRRWNGFPDVRALEIAPSDPRDDLANTTIDPLLHWRAFDVGRCPTVAVRYGPRTRSGELAVRTVDAESGRLVQRGTVTLLAAGGEKGGIAEVQPYCATPGFFRLEFDRTTVAVGAPPNRWSHPLIEYEVLDRSVGRREAAVTAGQPTVVADFACAERASDYGDGSDTVRVTDAGRYRVSGPRGWFSAARMGATLPPSAPVPSWFAYRIAGLRPGQPHRVTVFFPDDTTRTFVVAAKTEAHLGYRPGIGIETGGEFPVGGAVRSRSWTYWPLAETARLWLAPYHDGAGAACTRIRVERLDGVPRPVVAPGGRRAFHWYEEGTSYRAIFGAADEGFVASSRAIDRWLDGAVENGFDTVVPTASIYDQSLFPSSFNTAFSVPGMDLLDRLMIGAQVRGMSVVPELHPRGDDLLAGLSPDEADGLMLRRFDGATHRLDAAGRPNAPPHFDPLEPRVADWYLGAILEVATRYRDSPAFSGISLRYMNWANGAFNNLVSADWGYDDRSVERFLASIGRKDSVRGADGHIDRTVRESMRSGALREAWIDWRCRRIEELFARIVDAVRRVRPDLVLHLNVWADSGIPSDAASKRRLREAGLDLERLRGIEGLRIVVAAQPYGRREPAPRAGGTYDWLRAPAASGVSSRPRGDEALLAGHRYLELPPELDRPEAVGLRSSRRGAWLSVASNAAGDAAAERFAALLADHDPVALGDGGNAFVFGVEPVARLLRRFRSLPAIPFETIRADGDAVVARVARVAGRQWVYVVNASPFDMRVRIEGAAGLDPIDGDETSTTRLADAIAMRLRPFELAVLAGEDGEKPGPLRIAVDPRDVSRLRADVEALRDFAREAARVRPEPADALRAIADAADRDLDVGRIRAAWARLNLSGTWRALERAGCREVNVAMPGDASSACDVIAGRRKR